MKKTWLNSLLSASGEVSTKRVIVWLAFLLLCIAFGADITRDVHMDPAILAIFEKIVLFGMGFIASEKLFSKLGGTTQPSTDQPS